MLHFSKKKKKKKQKTKSNLDASNFSLRRFHAHWEVKGADKVKKTTRKLVARRREVLCLVSLFKIFFDFGVLIFIFYVSDEKKKKTD